MDAILDHQEIGKVDSYLEIESIWTGGMQQGLDYTLLVTKDSDTLTLHFLDISHDYAITNSFRPFSDGGPSAQFLLHITFLAHPTLGQVLNSRKYYGI